ncbi:MAG: FAD-dependent oxidoreductase, partial [Peptococcaceae bacterium]
MTLKYPELFTPFQIGSLEVKNRVILSPMWTAGWLDDKGMLTNEVLDYYEERAKGGVGLIFTHANCADIGLEESALTISPFRYPNLFIGQMRKLADRLHQYDTKLFIQISYGSGRVAVPSPIGEIEMVSSSETRNRWNPELKCRALETAEVENIVANVVKAAVICKMAGCDGIEVNCAYGGYLGDQFVSGVFNHRTDQYGGSLDNRLRVATDIVKGVKHYCGAQFPAIVRIGTKHHIKGLCQGAVPGEMYQEYGRDTEESYEIAEKLEQAGYDAILIGNGCYDSLYWLYPPMYQKDGLWLDDIAGLKERLHVPLICAGKITQPQMANQAIQDGVIDAVALGRALLADAHWAEKARAGKEDDIRPCIGCNNGCMARIFNGLPLQCAVNAEVMAERNSQLILAQKQKQIAIIGGGIAGMECARIAAMRGHDVTIYEKENRLGGATVAASVPEFKDADRRLLRWYEKQIADCGVNVV